MAPLMQHRFGASLSLGLQQQAPSCLFTATCVQRRCAASTARVLCNLSNISSVTMQNCTAFDHTALLYCAVVFVAEVCH